MSRTRRPLVAVIAAAALLLGAGIAVAAEDDAVESIDVDPGGDTMLNYGYDESNHVFVVGSSATDSTYDCTLENGTLTAGYGSTAGVVVPVDTLEDDAGTSVSFTNRPPEAVGPDSTPAEEPVEYAGSEGDCGVVGGVVGGDRGIVNHGQFMKLFHQLIDTRGKGCLNRIIARSSLGKGDQQIRGSELDPTFEVGESGSIDFETMLADCKLDKKQKPLDHPSMAGKDKAAKDETANDADSRGKSADAPGHNK